MGSQAKITPSLQLLWVWVGGGEGEEAEEGSWNSYFCHKLYANGFLSWQGAGSECVFHELTLFRWEGCSFNSPTEKVGKDVWRRGVPLQRQELLYKPAKAGCAGHSLPTVTALPRAQTHAGLSSHKDCAAAGDAGGSARGSPAAHSQALTPWSWFIQGSRSFPTPER